MSGVIRTVPCGCESGQPCTPATRCAITTAVHIQREDDEAEMERLREDHEAELAALRIENDALRDELQKVRRAAISGMDAATQHGRGLAQQAAKLRAESNPDALESERAMNAALTEQLERAEAAAAGLRADAERYRELRRLATAWPQTVLVVNINIGHDWRTADAPEEIDSVVDAAIDATLTQEDHND